MAEGFPAAEVSAKIGEHAQHGRGHESGGRHERIIAVSEALLLSIVAIIAAWSGYSAAKWGSESSLDLAKASAIRTEANRAYQAALTFRVGDALTFNAWFGAHQAGDASAERVAARRFRPEFRPAFIAWLATKPFTNPNAPAGPQAMPIYHATGEAASKRLDERADATYEQGQSAAETADKYIRTTVILASILFLVGISTQFPLRGVRYGLIGVSAVLLLFAVEQILALPGPPS